MIFPDGYGNPLYAGNGFFILENGEQCTIYDAVDKKVGTTFTVLPGASEFVLGTDTYIIQNFEDSIVVIDGIQQELVVEDINDIPVTIHSTYPVVQYKTFSGDIFLIFLIQKVILYSKPGKMSSIRMNPIILY